MAPLVPLLRGGRETLPNVEKLSSLLFISFIVICLGSADLVVVGDLGCWLWYEVRMSVIQSDHYHLLIVLGDCIVQHD